MKTKFSAFSLLLFFLVSCAPTDTCDTSKRAAKFRIEILGQITDPRISEISGMVRSRLSENVLWVINDSGDSATMYAINIAGKILAAIEINGAENLDWEDLASFEIDGEPCILIADIGNNSFYRDVFSLYIVKEPALHAAKINVQSRIDFLYCDRPRDCESIAVDPLQKKIFLLTKRDVPAVLYELNLENSDQIVTARRLGYVNSIPQPTTDEIKTPLDKYHAQPTAMDLLPDYARLAVLTYRRLLIYDHHPGKAIIESLNNNNAALIEYPALEQAEAMCFDDDGKSILITTEKLPAAILRITLE